MQCQYEYAVHIQAVAMRLTGVVKASCPIRITSTCGVERQGGLDGTDVVGLAEVVPADDLDLWTL